VPWLTAAGVEPRAAERQLDVPAERVEGVRDHERHQVKLTSGGQGGQPTDLLLGEVLEQRRLRRVGVVLPRHPLLRLALLRPGNPVEPAELARSQQEPAAPVRPARAATQIGPAHQVRSQPRHGVDVPLGQLVVQQVKISIVAVGVDGVALAGEDPVQPVPEPGEPGAAEQGRVVSVGLGVGLQGSGGRRHVRPPDAG
jgi:hypothetical protein